MELFEDTRDMPPDAVEALRVFTRAQADKARALFDPSDGTMMGMDEQGFGGGQWETGGYLFQSNFVHDTRFRERPYVSVHAFFKGDSQGSIQIIVEHTPEDLRRLDMQRLAKLRIRRAELDEAILLLEQKLAG